MRKKNTQKLSDHCFSTGECACVRVCVDSLVCVLLLVARWMDTCGWRSWWGMVVTSAGGGGVCVLALPLSPFECMCVTTGRREKICFTGWRRTFPERCSSMFGSFYVHLSICLSSWQQDRQEEPCLSPWESIKAFTFASCLQTFARCFIFTCSSTIICQQTRTVPYF